MPFWPDFAQVQFLFWVPPYASMVFSSSIWKSAHCTSSSGFVAFLVIWMPAVP